MSLASRQRRVPLKNARQGFCVFPTSSVGRPDGFSLRSPASVAPGSSSQVRRRLSHDTEARVGRWVQV